MCEMFNSQLHHQMGLKTKQSGSKLTKVRVLPNLDQEGFLQKGDTRIRAGDLKLRFREHVHKLDDIPNPDMVTLNKHHSNICMNAAQPTLPKTFLNRKMLLGN